MFASGRVWRQSVATAASLIVLWVAFSSVALAQAVPEPTPKAPRIEWRDGKTRITTENAHIEISNRVQFRFTQENPDTPPNGSPLAGVARKAALAATNRRSAGRVSGPAPAGPASASYSPSQ